MASKKNKDKSTLEIPEKKCNLILKKVLKYFGVFAFLITTYVVLLFLCALIPRSHIEKNLYESAEQINEKMPLDFSNAVMLDICYNIDSHEPLKSSLEANIKSNVYNGIDGMRDGYNGNIAFIKEFDIELKRNAQVANYYDLNPNQDYIYNYSYARFFHGYLPFLRPLFLIFNYKQVCIFYYIVVLLLLIVLALLLYKKKGIFFSICTIFLFFSIGCCDTYKQLFITPTIIVTLCSIIVLLKKKEIKDYYLYFFIVGSVTAYVSWMTITCISFFIPVLFYYLLELDESYSIKKFLKMLFIYFIGFIATMPIKWVITDLLYNTNVIQNAIEQLFMRVSTNVPTSTGKYHINYLAIIIGIFNADFWKTNYYALPIIISFLIFQPIKYIKRFNIKMLFSKENIIYLLIIISPFVQFAVLKNHSFIHGYLFSYKLLIISKLGIIILMYRTLLKCKNSSNDNISLEKNKKKKIKQ